MKEHFEWYWTLWVRSCLAFTQANMLVGVYPTTMQKGQSFGGM